MDSGRSGMIALAHQSPRPPLVSCTPEQRKFDQQNITEHETNDIERNQNGLTVLNRKSEIARGLYLGVTTCLASLNDLAIILAISPP